MSSDDLAKVRRRIAHTLARAALLKAQEMVHAVRKDRGRKRRKGGTYRLAKEFRALRSLLLAEKRPRLRAERNPRARHASQRRRALTAKITRPTTSA